MSEVEGIIALDPANSEHLAAAASLHLRLLPDSPVPKLGGLFMKKFYYNRLVRDGLVRCDLYQHDGKVVALSSYTEYPYTFMARGKKKNLLYLILLLIFVFITSPKRVRVAWTVARQARLRGRFEDNGFSGEYLSLAVLPEAVSFKDPQTGLRVPNALFERVIAYFKAKNFKEILLMIKKSNTQSQLFYQSYGAKTKENIFVPEDCILKTVSTAEWKRAVE